MLVESLGILGGLINLLTADQNLAAYYCFETLHLYDNYKGNAKGDTLDETLEIYTLAISKCYICAHRSYLQYRCLNFQSLS